MQEVHPVTELEAAAMAYAECVAQQDPFQIRMMNYSIHQMQEMQGFTAHILSSFSDRMVRAANDGSVTEEGAEGGRRLYLSVERARAHRAASEGDTSAD
ncbi:MAG TPA: hypothetical protein QGI71_01400 [Dehalococcoidia bacterium]|nr:hypothetical protein [Dehalococcoidia bacterium]